MRYWWVNQNQTYQHEFGGGYLWSPKVNANGYKNPFYESMREVSPGDLVLSFYQQHLVAIGVARSSCYESPKPDEFGNVGSYWNNIGWRIDVAYTELKNKIRPASSIDYLRPLLPEKYSPLRRNNGRGLQGVYLTRLPSTLMNALARLIGREVSDLMNLPMGRDNLREYWEPNHQIEQWEDYVESTIRERSDLEGTEVESLVRSRRGQGKFRENVIMLEKKCRVTKVDNVEHLVASHCKPWRHCEDGERLDGENGLMLTPSIDHLFDRGFISFEDSGNLIIAPRADKRSISRMGIEVNQVVNVGTFSSGQREYLDYHRNRILLQSR